MEDETPTQTRKRKEREESPENASVEGANATYYIPTTETDSAEKGETELKRRRLEVPNKQNNGVRCTDRKHKREDEDEEGENGPERKKLKSSDTNLFNDEQRKKEAEEREEEFKLILLNTVSALGFPIDLIENPLEQIDKLLDPSLSLGSLWTNSPSNPGEVEYERGRCYFYGTGGCAQNVTKGLTYLRTASELNNPIATMDLSCISPYLSEEQSEQSANDDTSKQNLTHSRWAVRSRDLTQKYRAFLANVSIPGVSSPTPRSRIIALCNLGGFYWYGHGVRRDSQKAFLSFLVCARAGYPRGIYDLAMCYHRGNGAPRDLRRAVALLKISAAEDDYMNDFSETSTKPIRGDRVAQYALGKAYQYGKGVKKDLMRATRCYLAAVRNDEEGAEGWAKALFKVGVSYRSGRGVAQDRAKATYYYTKAAELGHPKAQYDLGVMMYLGDEAAGGAGVDFQRAAELFRAAADQGHAKAQYNLGVCYKFGRGVAADPVKAVELYRKAAEEGGRVSALLALGVCYKNGIGVAKDIDCAMEMWQKCCDRNFGRAFVAMGVLVQGIGRAGTTKYRAMVSDFGMSRLRTRTEALSQMTTTSIGPVGWMAPGKNILIHFSTFTH